MRAGLVGLIVSLSASAQPARPKVVVLNLTPSEPGLERLAESLSEQVVTAFVKTGAIDAVAQSDLVAVLGLERQKQLLGCAESACMAELTAGLGAPWLVSGSLGRFGGTLRVDLKLVDTARGTSAFRDGRSVKDENEAFEVVAALVADLLPRLGVSTTAGAGSPGPWVVMGLGAAALIVGAVFSILAATQWAAITDPDRRSMTSWREVQSAGQAYGVNVVVGPSLLGAGLGAVTGGLLWRVLSARGPVAATTGPDLLRLGGLW